jgi:uncharacterized membrane protein YccC
MIQLEIILAAIKQFWKPAVGTVLLIVIVGFVWSWHSRGLKLEAAQSKIDEANKLAQEWRDAADECSKATLALEARNADFEQRLRDALNRQPETVIKYRDRVERVTETVISDDCPTAIAQMAALLADLPVCEDGP